jgi:hypothetical protein
MDPSQTRDIPTSASSHIDGSNVDRSFLQEFHNDGNDQFQDPFNLLGQFPPEYQFSTLQTSAWDTTSATPPSMNSHITYPNQEATTVPNHNALSGSMQDFTAWDSAQLQTPETFSPFASEMPSSTFNDKDMAAHGMTGPQYQNMAFQMNNMSSQPLNFSGQARDLTQGSMPPAGITGSMNAVTQQRPLAMANGSGTQIATPSSGASHAQFNRPSTLKETLEQKLPVQTQSPAVSSITPFSDIPSLPSAIRSTEQPSISWIPSDALNKSVSGTLAHRGYLLLGKIPVDVPVSKSKQIFDSSDQTSDCVVVPGSSVVPHLEERKSLKQLRQLARSDDDVKCEYSEPVAYPIADMLPARLAQLGPKVDRTLARIARASGVAGSPISQDSDSSSDSETESESESEEEEEQAPLPAQRPTEPLKAVEYDTIRAVWYSRYKYIEDAELFSKATQFTELFLKLRDDWKKANELLKSATESKSPSVEKLKSNVTLLRAVMERAINTALKHGHPDVLLALGQNKRFLAFLQPVLLDRAKESDHDGSLSIATLKLLVAFKGIKTEALEATKLAKVLSVFAKKGNDEVKALVKAINDNAVSKDDEKAKESSSAVKTSDATKQSTVSKAGSKAPDSPKVGMRENTKPETRSAESTGLKRARSESAGNSVVKKVNTGSPSSTKVISANASAMPPKKPLSTIGSKSSGNAAAATVTKPKVVAAPKSSNFFSNMQSAAKKLQAQDKPASSTVSSAAPAAAAPASSGFSFSNMLQDIMREAPAKPKTKTEETKSNETDAQKTKRLRKESRRHLRVSWPEDKELEKIRLFTHDPDEDTGHDANMIRDVADVGNEGRMFKQLHEQYTEIEEEEEEKEESFGNSEYRIPSEVDPSDAIEAAELSKHYNRFAAGTQVADSPDRKLQEEREDRILMEVYLTRADIPPRPKSPSEPYTNDDKPVLKFGQPNEVVMARSNALKPSTSAVDPALALDNVQDILSKLGLPPPKPVAPPAAVPQPAANDYSQLLSTFAQFSNPQNPPPSANTSASQYTPSSAQSSAAPAPPIVPPPGFPGFPLAGLMPPLQGQAPTPIPGFDLNSVLAAMSHLGQPAPPPQLEYTPAPAAPTPQPGSSGPDISSILASLAPYLPPGGIPPPIPGMAGFPGLLPPPPPNVQSQSQPQHQYDSYDQYEPAGVGDKKRSRDQDDDRDGYSGKRQNSGAVRGGGLNKKWQGKETANKSKFPVPEGKKYSLPCRFWPLGKCTKGNDCTYRHDPL